MQRRREGEIDRWREGVMETLRDKGKEGGMDRWTDGQMRR
jgi:hypothetical protein